MRLDAFLAEKGLAKSRSFAKTLIDEGFVEVNGKNVRKASLDVSESDIVVVTGRPYTYVGRGGVKLEAAIKSFKIDVSDFVCVDIGASSGGFTDCLLQNGAARVYAVDTGSDQLDETLRTDERVINIENFNARDLKTETLGELCDIAVTDVSFISQTLIIPAACGVLKENALYVSLIKPQFECGREGLGKGGIVKSKKVMHAAVEKVIDFADRSGLGCSGLLKSPILGGDGNCEFLMICHKNHPRVITCESVKEVCLS